MVASNIRAELKEGTADLHRQAEEALASQAPIESVEGLSHFLRCMFNAHSQFGAEYDHAARLAGLPSQSMQLLSALRSDLALEDTTSMVKTECDDQKSIGVGYVFEGSALGATIIKKRLSQSGINHPHYLNCVTASASSRWPSYVKYMDTCKDATSIIAGAVSTFEFIIEQAQRPYEQRS